MEDFNVEKLNKMKNQIEYYFSDRNLEIDRFLNDVIKQNIEVLNLSILDFKINFFLYFYITYFILIIRVMLTFHLF